jgi:hypothetical protein
MKYSAIKTSRWSWTYDDLGSESYNVLGALECALINMQLVIRTEEWVMDEMERYSYKFGNKVMFFKPSDKEGFLEPTVDIEGKL